MVLPGAHERKRSGPGPRYTENERVRGSEMGEERVCVVYLDEPWVRDRDIRAPPTVFVDLFDIGSHVTPLDASIRGVVRKIVFGNF